MRTIRVQRTIPAAPERVFDVLADHAGYARFPGIRSATLVREGAPEPNGLGAQREIDLGMAWFIEEITVFERPTRMDYRILRSRPPIEHVAGMLEFTPVSGGVEVTWTSTFRIRLPLIGGLATAVAARGMARSFAEVLRVVEERVAP